MGFQGQLSSVNLTDIFQTLNMNRQTGTLSVTGPVTTIHIYFDQGNITICTAPTVNGRPYLLDALANKGQLSSEKIDELKQRQSASRQGLREVVLASGMVADYELDEVSAWAIEELVCPIFEWQQGDFTFTDGPPVQELTIEDTITMGGTVVQTTQLVMEATRRMDEWKRIREIITDQDAYYLVDNDGRTNLKNVQTDPDMLKVLRFLDGRHTLDAIAMSVGVTRFDTFAIVAQLALAGVARPRTAQEVVEDAVALISQGESQQALELLEVTLRLSPVPEVMRPLAECCVKLNQAPRAVELYLELIQMGQDQGDLTQALQDLDTVITLSPDDPDLHFERGQVQSELGQVELAATSYSTAAQAYLTRKDLPRAIDACHRAKNLLPRAPEPHRYLARAYLLEGQTENATVEYKSLWHALLTAERPRNALETLKGILDADCKYNNVKEQVLSHAQNSEAIKTSKAMRYLVYILILCFLAAGGVAGWDYWQTTVVKGKGDEEVSKFETTVDTGMQALEHQDLLHQIEVIRGHYGGNSEVERRLNELRDKIETNYRTRADSLLARANALLSQNYKFDEAETLLNDLKQRFSNSDAAAQADTVLESIRIARIKVSVDEKVKEASKSWELLKWDDALAIIDGILQRKELPPAMRDQLAKIQSDWSTSVHSAELLYGRAQRIELSGSKSDALVAYRRAALGEGQAWIDRARARSTAIELDIAHDYGRVTQTAANRGDEQETFSDLDKLTALAKDASTRDVGDYLSQLELPFTIQIDNPHVQLVVRRGDGEEQRFADAPGRRGPWLQRIAYHVSESLVVEASRAGYASQSFPISAQVRRIQGTVALVRGPKWRIDLTGVAMVQPVIAGQLVLVCTDKSSVEMIDPVLGANRPLHLGNNLEEFSTPPIIYQDRAYVTLDDHVFAIDLGSRSSAWSWPDAAVQGDHLGGQLWVQEHELKPGSLLIFAAAVKAGVIPLEIDQSGGVHVYPHISPQSDVTGSLVVDHPQPNTTLLYVPTSSDLQVYDITSITDVSPPRLNFTLHARGDLIGKPVKAVVAGRTVMLISDMTGGVMAVDCDPSVPEVRRQLPSWVLDGTVPSTPVCLPNQPVAYVTVSEGRVLALDLRRPGQLLWRFPLEGTLGTPAGPPTIGRNGVYVADSKGLLHCLDPLSGAERWHADCGSPVVGGILAHDGRIFVPTKNAQLVCFEEGDE
jgi:outer membrane protein assembly factor BamB/tetratricopeptide (TPR) repeat protein